MKLDSRTVRLTVATQTPDPHLGQDSGWSPPGKGFAQGLKGYTNPAILALRSLPQGLAVGPSRSRKQHLGVWCVGAPLQPGLHWGPLEEEAVLEKGEGMKTSHEEAQEKGFRCFIPGLLSLAPCGAICTWKQSSSWTSLVQPGRLQSDGNVSLVWVSEKLHLRVSQAVLPGVELLLRPQPPQKSLNVLHPKIEEVAAIMVAEESAPREEAASPQEDSAESCTDPGHESPQSIQGDISWSLNLWPKPKINLSRVAKMTAWINHAYHRQHLSLATQLPSRA